MEMENTMHSEMHHATVNHATTLPDYSWVHFGLLGLFVVIVVGYLLRLTFFKTKIQNIFGNINFTNELCQLFCGLLMIPMVMPQFWHSLLVQKLALSIALFWAVFFFARWILTHILKVVNLSQNKFFTDLLHVGMFLGMGLMYYCHSTSISQNSFVYILWWLSGIFFLVLTIYYAKQLYSSVKNSEGQKRLLQIQTELSHLVVSLAMVCMVVWPSVFMVM